jgi:hypothetical protein
MPTRTRRRGLAAATALAVAGSLLLALPAAADEVHCFNDREADVLNVGTGQRADAPEVDLLAACVEYDGDVVRLSARPAQRVDPATAPVFTQNGGALVFELAVDQPQGSGDPQYRVSLSSPPSGPVWQVFDGDRDVLVCEPIPATGGDRLAYEVDIDVDACLTEAGQAPRTVRIGVFLSVPNALFDEVPPLAARYDQGLVDAQPIAAYFGVTRLAGDSRVTTAVAISRHLFPGAGSAPAVVVASGGNANAQDQAPNSPDALSAGPLATALGGPLLLTSGGGAPEALLAEVERVLAPGGEVVLVGGEVAVPPDVEEDLRALGATVRRVAGDTRFTTSLAVAQEISADPGTIALADGTRFEFALLGGAYAAGRAATGQPGVLLLTEGAGSGPGALPAAYDDYLDGAVSASVVAFGAAAAQAAGTRYAPAEGPAPAPGRVLAIGAGDDPFDASAEAARLLHPDPAQVAVASGYDFPDGLAGSVLAGRGDMPLLLSPPDVLDPAALAYLADRPGRLVDGFLLGGTAVLGEQVAQATSECGLQPTTPAYCTAPG